MQGPRSIIMLCIASVFAGDISQDKCVCRQARQELQALRASEALFNEPNSDLPNGVDGITEGLL